MNLIHVCSWFNIRNPFKAERLLNPPDSIRPEGQESTIVARKLAENLTSCATHEVSINLTSCATHESPLRVVVDLPGPVIDELTAEHLSAFASVNPQLTNYLNSCTLCNADDREAITIPTSEIEESMLWKWPLIDQ